ncbi:unnamed protein product [Symbiodinium sp. CCMP2456]|nr:unnamed protein product [Symbiodinium sp. CCMP2456]
MKLRFVLLCLWRLASSAKLRGASGQSETIVCTGNQFPLDADGDYHATGLSRGEDLFNAKDLAAFQEGLKTTPDWAVPVAWHLSVTVNSSIKEPVKFGFAGSGGFLMVTVPAEAAGVEVEATGRVAAGASDASFQYRDGPKVLNGDVIFTNFCLRPRRCEEKEFCGQGWEPKPPKTVGNSRLECCDAIACKDAKEVDGCSSTAWKQKANFDELKGYTKDQCCQPVLCDAKICGPGFKAKNATGLQGSTTDECCEPAYCHEMECPSLTQYTLLVHDDDGKPRRGGTVKECCKEAKCTDLDCGKSPNLAWRNKTSTDGLGSTFLECCDKNLCADFTCAPSSQWKPKNLPKLQGGSNEACCQPLMCKAHTCQDPKQTVPRLADGSPSLALGSTDEECCELKLCKDYTCSDPTKWSMKPLMEEGSPRKGFDDETCCEEIFCENSVDCERADGGKWRSKTPEALVGLQGSTTQQCCEANHCADYTCTSDSQGTGQGTKWYKKADTNHYRYQGSTDAECCLPKYCDSYETELPLTKWKRRKASGLLGSTDAECFEKRLCMEEVDCQALGAGANVTDASVRSLWTWSGSDCALQALQLRKRLPEVNLETLCSKADGVCALLSGDQGHSLTLSDFRMLLAVAPSTFQAYAEAVQLEKTAMQGDRVLCAQLCQVTAKFLASQHVALPPGPDIGCYQDPEGKDVCEEDLSPRTLATRFANSDLEASPQERLGRGKSAGSHRRQRSTVRMEDPYQHGFEALVQSYSSELALRIMYMFRVYPRAFNSYLGSPDAQPEDWQSKLAKFNLVARVFIMNAIRNLRLHQTVFHLAKWFGDDAVVEPNLNETRVEVLRLLNSAVHVMNTAEFIYNASACVDDAFAFVYPSAYDGVPDLEDAFRRNQKGQFVVYICPLTVYAERLGLLADAIQTSVHESSHHAVAYTDDVATCAQSHYMWMDVAGLPTLGGSACPENAEGQPRFSVSGRSCDVPGAGIWQIANITRPAFARGLEETARCPANLADLKTADACKTAAEYLGAIYNDEEQDPDWPQGCYEISMGLFQGVYFNSGSNGSAVAGTRPLCETLPLKAPVVGGGCPEKYSQTKTGTCTLALPFVTAAKGSNACPLNTGHIDRAMTCRSAADLLGLTWEGSVTSPDSPTGCSVQDDQVTFNGEEGTANSLAAPICKQEFSYSMFDPRVQYYIQLMRFSQSGDAALFKAVATDSSSDYCYLAYGRSMCQDLARQDPGKAIMNADSFGYYVIDAGSPATHLVQSGEDDA